jgi:drug/metabolite transporter (DMT)-like permease
MSVTTLAALGLLLNAFAWGLSWWPFRELQTLGLHPLWSNTLIYSIAMLAIFGVRPLAWRGMRAVPALWLIALGSGLTNVGFNWAVTIGDVVRVVLLFYMMPVWSMLLAWLILGERPTRSSLARVLLAIAGDCWRRAGSENTRVALACAQQFGRWAGADGRLLLCAEQRYVAPLARCAC